MHFEPPPGGLFFLVVAGLARICRQIKSHSDDAVRMRLDRF